MKRTLLVVEDEADDVSLIEEALADSPHVEHVEVVRDVRSALDYLKRAGRYESRADADPTLVLLDLYLPDGSGFDVLRGVRATPRLEHIPIAVLTSSERDLDYTRSHALHANAFVTKPVREEQFVQAIVALTSFWFKVALTPRPPRLP